MERTVMDQPNPSRISSRTLRLPLGLGFIAAVLSASALPAPAQPAGGNAPPPAEIESRLQSLRRSTENTTDIKAILDRYARFIEQYKDSPSAKEAERDVATWRERLEKGMVKVGTKWVRPAEREALKAQGLITAEKAREAMLRERTREADKLLDQALEEDPGNVSATYLRGLVLYNQNQVPAARK